MDGWMHVTLWNYVCISVCVSKYVHVSVYAYTYMSDVILFAGSA